MIKFIIPGKLPGLNDYTANNRGNKYSGAKIKKGCDRLIQVEIRRQLGSLKLSSPVSISYHWHEQNKRRDKDNIAFAKKFINDALVKSGVLAGDGWRNIKGFSDYFYVDPKNPRIEIEIEEVEK